MKLNKKVNHNDMTGYVCNDLTVIHKVESCSLAPSNRNKVKTVWICKCKCGIERPVDKCVLIKGTKKNCGNKDRHRRDANCIGKKIHRWTILEERFDKNLYILCKCDCGTVKRVQFYKLINNFTESCGCLTKEVHRSRKQNSFDRMVSKTRGRYKDDSKLDGRSFNLSIDDVKELILGNCYYCGIEPSWVVKLKGFEDQVRNGIDRVDSQVGYEKDNCVTCCRRCNIIKRSVSLDICVKALEFHKNPVDLISKKQFKTKYLVGKLYSAYLSKCGQRDIEFKLDYNQFHGLVHMNCFYCKKKPGLILTHNEEKLYYNTIDRIDNSQGYITKNTVPCCLKCNTGKAATSIDMMKKIIAFHEAKL